jgi:hypothetical protein
MSDAYRDLAGFVGRMSATRTAFIADNPWPFVVRLPDEMPPPDAGEDGFEYNTEVGGLEAHGDAVVIQAVKKRPGGLFPQRVGIGRTRTCDIALRFSSVSKLHAQFHLDEPKWTLVDVDSANGTFVNDERLVPRKPCLVAIGARLRFGTVETELVSADVLWDRLRKLRG